MNSFARGIWFLLNVVLGAGLASVLFYWVACDMQMPVMLTDFISTYLPVIKPAFDVPYVQISSISSSIAAKLLVDAFLCAIFGFAHTLFAQESVQLLLGRLLFPKQTLRTVYCIIVSVTVFLIMGLWQHTHVQLWNCLPATMSTFDRQLVLLIIYSIIYAPGWYVIIKFNPIEFCGMKQIFARMDSAACPYASSMPLNERTTGTPTLITSGLFRLCRHPLYLFTLLAWTLTPVMSLDRLAMIVFMCLYALIGIPFEERKLVRIFGQPYVDYQQRVPAVIPFSMSKIKQS